MQSRAAVNVVNLNLTHIGLLSLSNSGMALKSKVKSKLKSKLKHKNSILRSDHTSGQRYKVRTVFENFGRFLSFN